MLEKMKDKMANALGKELDKTAIAAVPYCTWTWFNETEMPRHMQEKAMQPIESKR